MRTALYNKQSLLSLFPQQKSYDTFMDLLFLIEDLLGRELKWSPPAMCH